MNDVAQESTATTSAGVRRLRPWLVVYVLSWREFVRFFRQRNRVVAAIGTPLLFWLLFGTGLHQSFQVAAEGPSFREFFFPGTLVLILMFTAIFPRYRLSRIVARDFFSRYWFHRFLPGPWYWVRSWERL